MPYLYLHGAGERAEYPSARAWGSPQRLAARYLECVLTQVASLRISRVGCEIVFVTNAISSAPGLGRDTTRLIDAIRSYDVEIRHAEYRHRLAEVPPEYQSARYTLDVVDAVADGDGTVFITDADCVWVRPRRVIQAGEDLDGAIGCVELRYPEDWNVNGRSPASIAELARQLRAPAPALPPWVGGELLAGSGATLRAMLESTAQADEQAIAHGRPMITEEHLLTLLRALGRTRFQRMNDVAGRISTGSRHGAVNPDRPLELGLWHLPSEKGLSLRRTAREVLRGNERGLARDLGDPARAARRFNVESASRRRRLWDDASLLRQRVLALLAHD